MRHVSVIERKDFDNPAYLESHVWVVSGNFTHLGNIYRLRGDNGDREDLTGVRDSVRNRGNRFSWRLSFRLDVSLADWSGTEV